MLSLAIALCALSQGAPNEMRLMRSPDIHGDKVVFTYASDLWLADVGGGLARRLTSHPGFETDARFSPDGSQIAFTGSYDGNQDVYVIPTEGGEPTRLTFEQEGDSVLDWTPDGKIAYASGTGAPWFPLPRLWLVKPTGGLPIPTNVLEINEASFSPDGTKLAYDRLHSQGFNWRRYRGGTQGVVSIWDFATNSYSELPHGKEQNWQPMWVGSSIYYISDKTLQTVNLYRYDTKTKQVQQLTKFTDEDIKWPATDGKTIVFEKGGALMTYTIADGKVQKLAPQVIGDKLLARPALRRLGDQASGVAISPSGKRVIVEARGDLFSVPVKNGETRPLTETPGVRESGPIWSPDGKTILFLSDASGEAALYTMPQMGGTQTKIATDPAHRIQSYRYSPDGKLISYTTADLGLYIVEPTTGKTDKVIQSKLGSPGNYDWSPDSKWIAYNDAGENMFGAAYLYEVSSKKTTKITEGYYADESIAFDLNGLYLYLVSGRTFTPDSGDFEMEMTMRNSQRVYVLPLSKDTPNPFNQPVDEEPGGQKEPAKKPDLKGKVDLDGMAERMMPLPLPPDRYQALVGKENGVLVYSQGRMLTYDMGGKAAADVMVGGSVFDFTPKRDKMAFILGPIVGVSDVRPGVDPNASRVSMNAVEAVIDPRAEWRQIFWEAWRFQRDHFYDPQMLGLDWKAIGNQYAKLLPYVAHREDLNYVLGLLIGELGTSHAYVGGGDMGQRAAGIPIGCLGADYEASNGKIRFKKIYRGFNFTDDVRGPLGEPGVNIKDGDYLLAIDGKPLTDAISPAKLLAGKAARTVVLTVNDKPTMDGAREERVKPIVSEGKLRYETWVDNNRKKVAQLSGGRIGYMHVPDTSEAGIIGMIKGYYSQSDKDAMIVDERFNGGGNIPTFFIEKLSRKIMSAFRARYGSDVNFPPQTVTGPMAMLINGYAGSGGDLFPWFFREAKLGPLIGKRTWGGLVGISGMQQFVDGGFMSAPAFGLYDVKTGDWIAENTGVDPDIDVDSRPDLIAKGEDPQLEEAVRYLLNQLEKGKAPFKTPSGFPRVKPIGK